MTEKDGARLEIPFPSSPLLVVMPYMNATFCAAVDWSEEVEPSNAGHCSSQKAECDCEPSGPQLRSCKKCVTSLGSEHPESVLYQEQLPLSRGVVAALFLCSVGTHEQMGLRGGRSGHARERSGRRIHSVIAKCGWVMLYVQTLHTTLRCIGYTSLGTVGLCKSNGCLLRPSTCRYTTFAVAAYLMLRFAMLGLSQDSIIVSAFVITRNAYLD